MTKPLFFLHIKGRGLMATSGFGRKGTRLTVLRADGSAVSTLARSVIDAAMRECRSLNSIDLAAATTAINDAHGARLRAVHVPGDFQYPPRIAVLPLAEA